MNTPWDTLLPTITPILLRESRADHAIQLTLDTLLSVSDVCRIYVFETIETSVHGWVASQIFETCREGVEPQLYNPMLQQIPMYPDYTRWMDHFMQNLAIVGLVSEFPEEERETLRQQDIKSLLVLPVLSAGKPIAFIGFDDTRKERLWSTEHLNVLKQAVIVVGSLLIRRNQEARIAQSQNEERALHQKVRAQQHQLQSLTENINDGIWMRDATTYKLLFTNKTLGKLFGFNHTAFDRQDSDFYLNYVHPSDRPYVAEKSQHHFKTKDNVTMEFRLLSADDKTRWVSARLFTTYDDSTGEATFHCGVLTDVTEQKKQMAVVQEARKRAEELNRVKSNILANIRHEFKTPLTGIKGYADLIKMTTEDDEIHQYAGNIVISSNRLHNTLDALLDYSILDAGLIQTKPEWITIDETISDLLDTLEQKAHHAGIGFRAELDGTDHQVYVDPHILYTICRQLFDNAVKFTRYGEIHVRIAAQRQLIHISVADTGCGIDTKYYNKIFEPFRQESEGVRRTHEGSGLGLPTVKKYLELVAGNIQVRPNEPHGTVFDVHIPLEEGVTPVKRLHLAVTDEPVKRILYVEDNLLMQSLLQEALKKHDIDVAATAEEALEMIEETCYDILLVDINLGAGMSGIEFAKIVRQNKALNEVFMCAVTASSKKELDPHIGAHGFNTYISKPFNISEIIRLVDQHADSSSLNEV